MGDPRRTFNSGNLLPRGGEGYNLIVAVDRGTSRHQRVFAESEMGINKIPCGES